MYIYKNTSLKLEIKLYDNNGLLIDPKSIRFAFSFYSTTMKKKLFTVSWNGKEAKNCIVYDDKVLCLLDNHGLDTGTLYMDAIWNIPDPSMTSGVAVINQVNVELQNIVIPNMYGSTPLIQSTAIVPCIQEEFKSFLASIDSVLDEKIRIEVAKQLANIRPTI